MEVNFIKGLNIFEMYYTFFCLAVVSYFKLDLLYAFLRAGSFFKIKCKALLQRGSSILCMLLFSKTCKNPHSKWLPVYSYAMFQ